MRFVLGEVDLLATVGIHDEYLEIAVADRGKGDLAAVW